MAARNIFSASAFGFVVGISTCIVFSILFLPRGSDGNQNKQSDETLKTKASIRPRTSASSKLQKLSAVNEGDPFLAESTMFSDLLSRLQNASEMEMPDYFERLKDFQDPELRYMLNALAERWNEINPVGAAEFCENSLDFERAQLLLCTLLANTPEPALGKLFDWLNSLDGGEKRNSLMGILLYRAVTIDPVSASIRITNLPEGKLKNAAVSNLVGAWSKQDPDAALNWINSSLNSSTKFSALSYAAVQIAEVDPERASKMVDLLPFGKFRNKVLREVGLSWFRNDFNASKNWMLSLETQDRQEVAMVIGGLWAKKNPLDAAAFGASLSDAGMKDYYQSVFSVWGAEDPRAAMKWIDLNNSQSTELAFKALTMAWASTNPQEAASEVTKLNNNIKKAVLVNSIAGQWAKSDPSEAAKFADNLPMGELKSNAVSEVASYWVRQDSIGASVWLGAMDDGEAKDRGIVQMASYIAEADAKAAIQWSASISNPITREKYIRMYATEWINRGGKLAESQIESLGLLPSDLKLLNR